MFTSSLFNSLSRRVHHPSKMSEAVRNLPPLQQWIRPFSVLGVPYKRVVGHKMEIRMGKKTKKTAFNTPRIPMHPIFDQQNNLNLFISYRDLKLRWRKTTKVSRNTVHLARKWRPMNNYRPLAKPTSSFILHSQLPHKTLMPDKPSIPLDPNDPNLFCVFKSYYKNQHKVTVGDLVQTERIANRNAGDKVVFGTVLLVGSKNYTIIGKPTVPYARVHCTVEQQTLTRDLLVFKHKLRKRWSHFRRHRQWVTILRVDKIEVDYNNLNRGDKPIGNPSSILDLFANRKLYPEELITAQKKEGEELSEAQKIFDGTEHAPGFYQRKALSETFRCIPDPYAPDFFLRR